VREKVKEHEVLIEHISTKLMIANIKIMRITYV
jgi:hypothetical protein